MAAAAGRNGEAIGNWHGGNVAIADGAAWSSVAAYSFRLALAALCEAHGVVQRLPSDRRVNSRSPDDGLSA